MKRPAARAACLALLLACAPRVAAATDGASSQDAAPRVGVTDRISVGAGTPLVCCLGGEQPFWITPKVQVYAGESVQASVGVMHFLNVGDGNFGIAYVVATRGTADSAVTGGVGYAYDRSYNRTNGAAVAMIGAEHRFTRRVKTLTENYVFDGGVLLTGGVR